MVAVYVSPQIVTGVGGTDATVLGSSPSSVLNWASYAAVYDEYRILAMKVTFHPYNKYLSASTRGFVAMCVDHDSVTPLASLAIASQYSSFQMKEGTAMQKIRASMSSTGDAVFTTTGVPTNLFGVKTFAFDFGATQIIGRYEVQYRIQFRGKGI